MSALSEATAAVNAALDSLPASTASFDESERTAALAACQRLKESLQSTREACFDIAFVAQKPAAVRIGMGMGIFNTMAAARGAATTANELSEKTGVEALMIDGSPMSYALTHVGGHEEAIVKLPVYLESTDYATPSDAFHGPWQYAMQTDLHHFDWLKTKPKLQAAFNNVMGMRRAGRGEEWFDFYPVAEKLRVEKPDDVLLIDIGGGRGHDLVDFHRRHSNLPGKLILQDLPTAIDDINEPLPSSIEAQRHDFFTPQPVKGAKAYYLRTVLHDWPDKQALQILRNVREAMCKGSVLLVNENCLRDRDVPLFEAQMDFTMMVLFASLERTEVQWRKLLGEAGFRVTGVYRPRVVMVGSGTLFEAVAA
ncbi:MAG: hypothetical protein M1819_000935 [Sarea resinae]|nr:MAG: hypothetical protein M1819_000935 [Sarea resinae]